MTYGEARAAYCQAHGAYAQAHDPAVVPTVATVSSRPSDISLTFERKNPENPILFHIDSIASAVLYPHNMLLNRTIFSLLPVLLLFSNYDLLAISTPAAPREYLDTSMPIQSGSLRTVSTVNNCNDPVNGLQAHINAARLGDTIVIPAGSTCIGNYILKNKTTGSGWIIIQSSAADQLPEQQRVTPETTSKLAKLIAPKVGNSSNPVFKTESYTHHYRLIGLEMTPDLSATWQSNAIVDLGSEESTTAAIPTDIIIDRCYVHGHKDWEGRRGIKINSRRTSIINSYISRIHQLGYDTQGIGGWNGPGPFKIVNNYVEAAGENVMFGGALPTVNGLIASDIEIRQNHIYKPFRWKIASGTILPGGTCAFDGDLSSKGEFFELLDSQGNSVKWYQCNNGAWVVTSTVPKKWTVKNLFELKSARRVLLEGNIFENNWAHAQNGFGLLLQGMPSDSGTWAVVEDVTFRNNIIRRTAGAFNMCGGCFYAPVQTTDPGAPNYADPKIPRVNRVSVVNNIFEDINQYLGSGFNFNGYLLQILSNTQNVSFTHNTAFPSNTILWIDGNPCTGLSFVDNIVNHGPKVIGYGPHGGIKALNEGVKGWTMVNNVMVAPPSSVNNQIPYPSGNFFPSSYDAVGFVNHNNGLNGDYRLTPSSPYKQKGTDGKNIGAKVDAVTEATQGVATTVASRIAEE